MYSGLPIHGECTPKARSSKERPILVRRDKLHSLAAMRSSMCSPAWPSPFQNAMARSTHCRPLARDPECAVNRLEAMLQRRIWLSPQMPLPKMPGAIPGLLQHFGQSHVVRFQTCHRICDENPGGSFAEPLLEHHGGEMAIGRVMPVRAGRQSCHDAAACRRTERACRVSIGKEHAARGTSDRCWAFDETCCRSSLDHARRDRPPG